MPPKATVTGVEKDGEYLSVRFTRADGQRVEAYYQLLGWVVAPGEVLAAATEMTRTPPTMVVKAAPPSRTHRHATVSRARNSDRFIVPNFVPTPCIEALFAVASAPMREWAKRLETNND